MFWPDFFWKNGDSLKLKLHIGVWVFNFCEKFAFEVIWHPQQHLCARKPDPEIEAESLFGLWLQYMRDMH